MEFLPVKEACNANMFVEERLQQEALAGNKASCACCDWHNDGVASRYSLYYMIF